MLIPPFAPLLASVLLAQSQIPLLLALLAALLVVTILIVRQLGNGSTQTPSSPAPAPHRRATTTQPAVASWGYQLQKLDLARAAASPFDVLVIDTTRDGSDATALTPRDLDALKRKPDGTPRRVLAYLSIGEAESYRAYWDPQWKHARPDWLLGENPDWRENYAVCFWRPEWQSLMCGDPQARLDRVIAQGFDGVYLDKCDVFDDLHRRYKAAAASRPDIRGDMVAFIARLSAYAKSKSPGFLVVMQNAEELVERAELRSSLDGIAKEELVYGGDGPEKRNSHDDIAAACARLDLMAADGKLVLVVEYLDAESKIRDAVETIRPLGYTLYIARKNRKLASLEYETMLA